MSFSLLGWRTLSILKRELGIPDQALLPSATRSHSFSGLVVSPAKRQLMPTMAIGTLWLALMVWV